VPAKPLHRPSVLVKLAVVEEDTSVGTDLQRRQVTNDPNGRHTMLATPNTVHRISSERLDKAITQTEEARPKDAFLAHKQLNRLRLLPLLLHDEVNIGLELTRVEVHVTPLADNNDDAAEVNLANLAVAVEGVTKVHMMFDSLAEGTCANYNTILLAHVNMSALGPTLAYALLEGPSSCGVASEVILVRN
jgi:hypothetical protein